MCPEINEYDDYIKEVNEIIDFMGKNNFWSKKECDNWLQMSDKDYQTDKIAAIEFLEYVQDIVQRIIDSNIENPQLKYN